MNSIEKLENIISLLYIYIEENNRIDRITKQKIDSFISELYTITGEIKENRDNVYEVLHDVLNML